MTINTHENILLRDLTTFRIGGPARFFVEVESEAELVEALAWARESGGASGEKNNVKKDIPIFILGGGSNILVSDQGFDGLVIKMNICGVDFGEEKKVGIVRVTAGAGENWDDLVAECVSRGFSGVENLSGIPGTVGATPVQNIGAYGADVAQVIESVRAYDTEDGAWKTFSNKNCEFEYRDSIFKHAKNSKGGGRYVITSVVFLLKKFTVHDVSILNTSYKDLQNFTLKNPIDVRMAVLSIRAKKLPDVRHIGVGVGVNVGIGQNVGTAGSYFKNPIISSEHYLKLKKKYPDMPSFPTLSSLVKKIHEINNKKDTVKIPLAWILDHVCGYRGATKGAVGTYQNQALVIVNNGNATSAEIRAFATEISANVKEKTGIEIEPEVQYVE